MNQKQFLIFIVSLLTLLLLVRVAPAAASDLYNVSLNDSLVQAKADSSFKAKIDSLPFFKDATTVYQVEKLYQNVNKTANFYLIIALLMALGVLRMSFPSYFRNLYQSFMSPMTNKRTLREQIEQNVVANAAMNIFFCISLGLFIFALISFKTELIQSSRIPANLMLLGLILGTGLVYLIKLGVLNFVGWTFKMQQATEDYIYNVFLINKILGIALLPFSIILTFGTGNWLNLVFIVAIVITAILILNRYTRSWSSLGSFFQFSKFHFFMYFCASELLPLAILTKFTYNILI